jgi:FecR protein
MQLSARRSIMSSIKASHWRSFFGAACLACLVWGMQAQAASSFIAADVLVDGLQMPAWLERNGVRQPLLPGQTLQNRDRVFTGAKARLRLQLADGSTVKIGEHAELHLNALGRRDDQVFTGALEFVRGAFRLTTGAALEARAFNVRIASITVGTRSADLWGRVHERGDSLCLLEGQLMMLHAKDDDRYLSEPLSCYFAPKGTAPKLLDDIDAEQVGWLNAQTEMQAGQGYTQRGGLWSAEWKVLDNEAEALKFYDQARDAGYAVSIQPHRAQRGVYHYVLNITQLPTPSEASALAARLKRLLQPSLSGAEGQGKPSRPLNPPIKLTD